MKTIQRLLLLGISSIFLLSSCAEDEEPIDYSDVLIGSWQHTIDLDKGVQIHDLYSFTGARNYTRKTMYHDSASNSVLSFSGKESGSFTLSKDQLVIKSEEVARALESYGKPYDDEGMLIPYENFSRNHMVEFNTKEDKMIWKAPPFGPLEFCLGSTVFDRIHYY